MSNQRQGFDCDVVVVGAGAAGAAAAWRLSTEGLKVVCLEQGSRVDPARYPSTSSDWELEKLTKFSPFPGVRQGPSDYPIDDDDSAIAVANFNAVGGSTILYSGHFPRFHPSDFRVATLDNVADDWPISYRDLEPYFALNDKMMGVAGLEGDPAYPPITNLLPPVPMGKVGSFLGDGFNRLGWHWWPAYSAIATRSVGHRAQCINLGPCNAGCSQGAKGSVDVTYWPSALANGVDLRTESCVREVVLNDDDSVRGVLVVRPDKSEYFLSARAVVLACSGIGTPRVLLASTSPRFPNGLANRSGMVGRRLMLHPCGYIEGLFSEDLESHLGPQGCVISSQEFYESDPSRGFVRGFTFQVLRGPSPVETAVNGMLRREIRWGENHHDDFERRFGHIASMAVIVEDLPDDENRVTLDDMQVDRFGLPGVKVTYELGENSKKMMSYALSRGRELMVAAGAQRTSAFGPVRETGWHLMGTTRMGNDASTSVVNQFGRCHDLKNLYIADSSIFVTSGGVNPTSTLQALALWVADHMKKDLATRT